MKRYHFLFSFMAYPALALAMEPAAPDLMMRPPRDPEEPVIPAAELGSLARDASLIAASAFAAQAVAVRLGGSAQSGQTGGALTNSCGLRG
jgi:Ca2+-transporting ATPase